MTIAALLQNPVVPRAIVIGLFGGAGLALTEVYSRRGPMILPMYAAILAALAFLLSRFPDLSYAGRVFATLIGFCVASAVLYVTVGIRSGHGRRRLVEEGRLPPSALTFRLSIGGHAWRIGFLLAIGTVVSAGVAFIAA